MTHPVLFGAVPIARGEGLVESLSGFFARLCLARFLHATPVWRAYLLDRCHGSLFPAAPLGTGAFLGRSSGPLDVLPASALAFASALEDLTSLSNLRACTLVPLSQCIHLHPGRRQNHLRKHWCPACLARWDAEGVPYEPLLWRLALVVRCPRHRLKLLDRCPTCASPQPVVTQGVPIGYCVRCGHALYRGADLSSPDEHSLDATERWLVWRSVAVSRLLAWSSALPAAPLPSLPIVSAFVRLLEHALERPPDPSLRNRLALSCALGINSTHFYPHLSGALRPTLSYAIDTCMQLGVDPVSVARGDYREGERSWPAPDDCSLAPCSDPWALALEARESWGEVRFPERAGALDAFIADDSATDLPALIAAQRSAPASLALSFPVRFPRARELRDIRLARHRQATLDRFNHMLDQEIASGSPRPIVEIAASLGIRHALLTSRCPERCDQIRRLRQALFSTNRPDLRDHALSALRSALRVADGPSLASVAHSLDVGPQAIRALFPDECRELVALRDRERSARRAHYIDAMRADLARSRPRGVVSLVADLGIHHVTLKRADPALYARLSSVHSKRLASNRRSRAAGTRARATAHAKARRARLLQLSRDLEKALRTDSPPSLREVARASRVDPKRLRSLFPDLCQRLQGVRRRGCPRRLETLRRELEAELARPSPRSLWAFSCAHHTTISFLTASFPDLVFALRDAYRRAPRPFKPRPRPGDARILAALGAEAELDSPRSVRTLAKSLGVSFSTLERISRPAVDRIIATRKSR